MKIASHSVWMVHVEIASRRRARRSILACSPTYLYILMMRRRVGADRSMQRLVDVRGQLAGWRCSVESLGEAAASAMAIMCTGWNPSGICACVRSR